MSFKGHGALAMWYKVAPIGRHDFYLWHESEHIPDRLSIPGFIRARRYIDVKNVTFFNLFELKSLDVLRDKRYTDQRDRKPSRLETRVAAHFEGIGRAEYALLTSHGEAEGGFLSIYKHCVAKKEFHQESKRIQKALLSLINDAGVVSCHLMRLEGTGAQETELMVLIESSTEFLPSKHGSLLFDLRSDKSNRPTNYQLQYCTTSTVRAL